MSELLKMTIFAFTDQGFTKKASPEKYVLQINPATIKFAKEIEQTTKGPVGGQFRAPKYARHKEINLSFDTVLDATGVLPYKIKSIDKEVDELEKVTYDLYGDKHRPNYLKVSWGAFIFKGILKSINYDYTLFSGNGIPLRVKITFSLIGFMDKLEAARRENKCSPDLSRVITFKAGETIAYWCNEIYGDPSYCVDVAKYNELSNMRNIKPGTKIMFPALKQ